LTGKNHITFTAADIERYHKGEMTASEMHAMEKAALDDPFLADALEGYAYSKQPAQEVAALRTEIKKRTANHRGKLVAFPLNKVLRIAALFLVIAGIGWIAFQLPFSKSNDIAQTWEPVVIKPNAKQKDSNLSQPAIINTGSASNVTTNSGIASEKNTHVQESRSAQPARKTAVHKAVKKEELNDEPSIALATPHVEKNMQQQNGEDGFTALNNKVIKGRIRSNNGEPVPYASIVVNGSVPAQADLNGYFAVKAADSTAVVNINAAGYDKSNARISVTDSNVIVLQERPALSEVVVSGYKKPQKNRAPELIIESGELEPEQGWVQYNEYIASKLKPDPALQAKQRGEVALSFDVNDNGEPINITIENSDCTECNGDAIKLLKEGPKWKVKKGRKGKIAFRF
jgi:hypothetical protein